MDAGDVNVDTAIEALPQWLLTLVNLTGAHRRAGVEQLMRAAARRYAPSQDFITAMT